MKTKKSKLNEMKSFQIDSLNQINGGEIKTGWAPGGYYSDTYVLFDNNSKTVITKDYLIGSKDNGTNG